MKRHIDTEISDPGFPAFKKAEAERADQVQGIGAEIAPDLLELGERHPAIAQVIFEKYHEIVDAAEQVEIYVQESLGKDKKIDQGVIERIREALLRRAKDVLVRYQNERSTEEPLELDRVRLELDNLKAGVLLYGAVFKGMIAEGQGVDLEVLADAEFIVDKGVRPADVPQMRGIYARNYRKCPEFQAELLQKFDHVMSKEQGYGAQDGNNTFYLLKVDGQVVAFVRFADLGEDREGLNHQEFCFFNVDPDYQGLALGEAMMERSVDREAQTSVLEATCRTSESISMNYIKRGFIGVKFEPNHKGVPLLHIERDDESNKSYASKSAGREEIIESLAGRSEVGVKLNTRVAKFVVMDNPADLPFDLTNQDWILTQYFEHEQKYYAVFEREERFKKPEYLIQDGKIVARDRGNDLASPYFRNAAK